MIRSKKRAFTLIELVIVIAILVILISIAVPRFQQSNLSAQAAAHNANVKVIKNAAILYLADNPEVTSVSIDNLTDYLEGDVPKPAKSLNQSTFTVSSNDGDILVTPGNVRVEGRQLVAE